MARSAILALTAIVAVSTLFSGCLSHATAAASPASSEADPSQAAGGPSATSNGTASPAKPPCPTNWNNYGTSITLGDTYIVSPSGSNLLVVYKESNGCQQLQTEEQRPTDPDTKIAEIPYPISQTPAAAPQTAADHRVLEVPVTALEGLDAAAVVRANT